MDSLLNVVLPLAQQHLANYGEFYPFAASLDTDGKGSLNMADIGEEFPESQPLIDMLRQVFIEAKAAGELRAYALCYDIYLRTPGTNERTDAICIEIEHETEGTARIDVPYHRDSAGGIEYKPLEASELDPYVFK